MKPNIDRDKLLEHIHKSCIDYECGEGPIEIENLAIDIMEGKLDAADCWVSFQEIRDITEKLKAHQRELRKTMSPARVPGRSTLYNLHIAIRTLEELLNEPSSEGPKQ